MTENGKIFLTKKSIYDLLSQQQFSIGLSLYIIQDIEKELQQGYNDILTQDLQEQNIIKQEKQKNQQQQIMNFSNPEVYPIEWIPEEEEKEEENEGQVN